jgi:hypothetical protein
LNNERVRDLEYTPDNLARLGTLHGGMKIIVANFLPDNQMVFRTPKPSHRLRNFASFYLSIWNLDTGKISGDCNPDTAQELHMNSKRFAELKKAI